MLQNETSSVILMRIRPPHPISFSPPTQIPSRIICTLSFPHTAVEGLITGTIICAVAGLLTMGAAKLYDMAVNYDL
ncbi:MAG: hypothetical protein HYU64_17650 [Armatimonadetes bacterium]|nr:hypothetical protein [Armatimonadota bacterium]